MFSEGLGMRSLMRIIGCRSITLHNLRTRTAATCRRVMAKKFHSLHLPFLQVDELWTYIQKKKCYCPNAERGIVWIFVSLDEKSKLCPAFLIGKRQKNDAQRFMEKLQACLACDSQISTDGLSAYLSAIERTNNLDREWTTEEKVYLAHARTVGSAQNGRKQTNHVENHNGQLRNHVSMLRRQGKGIRQKSPRSRGRSGHLFFLL